MNRDREREDRDEKRKEAADRVKRARKSYLEAHRGCLATEPECWRELQDACRALLECE